MQAMIMAAALAAQTLAAPGPPTTAAISIPPVTSPAQLSGARQFDMTSKATGRTYRIYVYNPRGPAPPGGFPVLYVLDGDWAFGTANFQALAAPLDGRSPVVVIGIGYPDGNPLVRRNPDLTPSMPAGATLVDTEKEYGPVKPGSYGDAENFYRFMTEELRPIVAQSYKTDPKNQSLMGYSLGGLFGLHVLFRHTEAYQSYVIGSPSIWWNNREVLKDEAAFGALVRAGKAAPRILITSDELEQSDGASGQDSSVGRMVDNARELATRLTALKGGAGYKVHYTLFSEETHLTGMPASTSRGVAFVTAK